MTWRGPRKTTRRNEGRPDSGAGREPALDVGSFRPTMPWNQEIAGGDGRSPPRGRSSPGSGAASRHTPTSARSIRERPTESPIPSCPALSPRFPYGFVTPTRATLARTRSRPMRPIEGGTEGRGRSACSGGRSRPRPAFRTLRRSQRCRRPRLDGGFGSDLRSELQCAEATGLDLGRCRGLADLARPGAVRRGGSRSGRSPRLPVHGGQDPSRLCLPRPAFRQPAYRHGSTAAGHAGAAPWFLRCVAVPTAVRSEP